MIREEDMVIPEDAKNSAVIYLTVLQNAIEYYDIDGIEKS